MVTLELFAGGRLKVQTLGSSEFEPGTVLRRIDVRVDGMLLASVPFTLDEYADDDDEDLDDAEDLPRAPWESYYGEDTPPHLRGH